MMQETAGQTSLRRRQRVQMLKKLIVGIWIAMTCIPLMCCVVLFVKVNKLNHTLTQLSEQLIQVSDKLEVRDSLNDPPEEKIVETVGEGHAKGGESQDLRDDKSGQIAEQIEKEHLHQVYLTFDDGPSIFTKDILDILDRYEVKATFFVVGKEDEASQEVLKEIVAKGHSLGMHSYSHKYSEVYRSLDSFCEDFEKLRSYLYDVTGVESTLYRFPGGSSNTVSGVDMQELVSFLDENGVTFYDWNICSGDASSGSISVQQLVKNSTKDIEKWHTAIVLMHDAGDKRSTVEALPMIIENILAMDDTVILPITEDTAPVQHIHNNINQ